MSNAKISALTSATTPLAGTEVAPIVQSGATVKATMENIVRSVQPSGTAYAIPYLNGGKAATTSTTFTYTGTQFIVGAATTPDSGLNSYFTNGTVGVGVYISSTVGYSGTWTNHPYGIAVNGSEVWRFDTSSNLVPKTAAKGINFTANTPAAGMTSQLLNWYEEGTWTPNQGAGLTLVGAFTSTGRYTRIGRQVSISGTVTGATSVAVVAAGVVTSNLPFTVVTAGHGGATNVANNASATIICTGTSVTSAAAIAATATITFSATYFV